MVALSLHDGEGHRLDTRKGRCGHCVTGSLLHVIGAYTLGGVGERAFLCGVCMLSSCPQGFPVWVPISQRYEKSCVLYRLPLGKGRLTGEWNWGG